MTINRVHNFQTSIRTKRITKNAYSVQKKPPGMEKKRNKTNDNTKY